MEKDSIVLEADFNLVLYRPQIPQNTGSIARLCAGTGASLHLIHPLGFRVDDASVKRAGLDYWEQVRLFEYKDWEEFLQRRSPSSLSFFSKFGERSYVEAKWALPCYLIFGNETNGLTEEMRIRYAAWLYQIPMRTHLVRSLNLAQCAAIVLYEALRRENFFSVREKKVEPVSKPIL